MIVEIEEKDIHMSLGNNGVTFLIRNGDGKLRGRLRIGKATVEWRKGKSAKGVKVDLDTLIEAIEEVA